MARITDKARTNAFIPKWMRQFADMRMRMRTVQVQQRPVAVAKYPVIEFPETMQIKMAGGLIDINCKKKMFNNGAGDIVVNLDRSSPKLRAQTFFIRGISTDKGTRYLWGSIVSEGKLDDCSHAIMIGREGALLLKQRAGTYDPAAYGLYEEYAQYIKMPKALVIDNNMDITADDIKPLPKYPVIDLPERMLIDTYIPDHVRIMVRCNESIHGYDAGDIITVATEGRRPKTLQKVVIGTCYYEGFPYIAAFGERSVKGYGYDIYDAKDDLTLVEKAGDYDHLKYPFTKQFKSMSDHGRDTEKCQYPTIKFPEKYRFDSPPHYGLYIATQEDYFGLTTGDIFMIANDQMIGNDQRRYFVMGYDHSNPISLHAATIINEGLKWERTFTGNLMDSIKIVETAGEYDLAKYGLDKTYAKFIKPVKNAPKAKTSEMNANDLPAALERFKTAVLEIETSNTLCSLNAMHPLKDLSDLEKAVMNSKGPEDVLSFNTDIFKGLGSHMLKKTTKDKVSSINARTLKGRESVDIEGFLSKVLGTVYSNVQTITGVKSDIDFTVKDITSKYPGYLNEIHAQTSTYLVPLYSSKKKEIDYALSQLGIRDAYYIEHLKGHKTAQDAAEHVTAMMLDRVTDKMNEIYRGYRTKPAKTLFSDLAAEISYALRPKEEEEVNAMTANESITELYGEEMDFMVRG